jgi:hypothetical protein
MLLPRDGILFLVAAHLAVAQISGQSALPACGVSSNDRSPLSPFCPPFTWHSQTMGYPSWPVNVARNPQSLAASFSLFRSMC